jgi:hypothetical protein
VEVDQYIPHGQEETHAGTPEIGKIS